MYNHAPADYICPICLGVQGVENEHTLLMQADRVLRDDVVSAFINSFWVGRNEGHVIVVPNNHYEHLYELPDDVAMHIMVVAKRVALALKAAYGCDGITVRQNNEPASEQHAFHYHLHLFPRYDRDDFNQRAIERARLSDPQERLKYAEKLRAALQ